MSYKSVVKIHEYVSLTKSLCMLQLISEDLESLQQKQVNMLAKLEEYKRKHIQLSHRLLQV